MEAAPGTNTSMPAPQGAPDAGPEAAAAAAKSVDANGVVTASTVPPGGPTDTSVDAAAAATAAAAQAAAETKPAAEIAPTTLEAPTLSVQETGNGTFDEVGKILFDKGFKNTNEILDQAAKGEISLENKAALVEALGEGVAGLLLNNLETEMSSVTAGAQAENARLKDYATELFGATPEQGEEVWAAMNAFANSKEAGLSDADRSALNEMLGKGGAQAEMALREVNSRYQRSQGFTQVPELVGGTRPNQSGFQPITKADYQTEVAEVARKFGDGSVEMTTLNNRRTASIARGY